ncbi:hypothetical protein L198_06232 [Cryptococcus wingfieldii CBS 7118]|uniref:Uncharacterized protein n=1 Tax=Cryptococcus wingfieldii CBS 7118 TaxID=1295528 RepID=A0A1E3INN8_9TREE|nr:hypothetical protein L198_06232 [Cryptococcus wingfieldii CBS 7118]ODN90214.1 hypothetical protein L198_06232 [Cryptococcus wingfieldii CBS 7118]
MSLPYDATPPPQSPPPAPQDDPMDGPAGLDQALDDYAPPVPSHVQDLMARMSRNKVYLVEESPAILHVDAMKERVRRDPKVKGLMQLLEEQDPSVWLGIEWLNDTSLHVLFETSAEALLALSLLSKTGFDPVEGDDPLMERSAHSFPIHLLPQAPQKPIEERTIPAESSSEDAAVNRRGRGMFAGDGERAIASEISYELAPGVNPLARIAIRIAFQQDADLKGRRDTSKWYATYGRDAGKESLAQPRRVGKGRSETRWESAPDAYESGGHELLQRVGRERKPYDRPEPRGDGRGRGRPTQDDLDRQLDNLRSGGGGSMDVDGGGASAYGQEDEGIVRKGRGFRSGGGGGRGGGRRERPKPGKEDLDKGK